jgi:hypothetical protein
MSKRQPTEGLDVVERPPATSPPADVEAVAAPPTVPMPTPDPCGSPLPHATDDERGYRRPEGALAFHPLPVDVPIGVPRPSRNSRWSARSRMRGENCKPSSPARRMGYRYCFPVGL